MALEILTTHLYEVFIFIRIATSMICKLGTNYLIQDKYCLNYHNQTMHFCQNINVEKTDPIEIDFQNQVYADTATFSQYR